MRKWHDFTLDRSFGRTVLLDGWIALAARIECITRRNGRCGGYL
jgi:hypothetical protein